MGRKRLPIENERKFVLKIDTSEKECRSLADSMEDIEQIYLLCGKKQSVRVRRILGVEKYWLTFKQDIGKKTVEVEVSLSRKDYKLLGKQGLLKLRKWRYRIGDWELDFFKIKNRVYFVQAEIEMPEGQKKPKEILPFVKENLLYAVRRGDGRFSNKKLADPEYARQLMEKL